MRKGGNMKTITLTIEAFLKLASADAIKAGVSLLQFLLSIIILAVEEVDDDRPNNELRNVIDSIEVKLPPRRLKGGGEANPACPLPAVREYLLKSIDLSSLKGEIVQFCIDSPDLNPNPRVLGLAVFGNLTRPTAGRRKNPIWLDIVRNVQTFRQISEASGGVRVVYHEAWVRAEWPRLRPAVERKLQELDMAVAAAATEVLKGGSGLDARLALREVTLKAQRLRQAVASVDRWYERITGSKPASPEVAKPEFEKEEPAEEFEEKFEEAEPAEFEEFEEAAEPESEARFEQFEEEPAEEFEEEEPAELDLTGLDDATLNLLLSAGGQLAAPAAAELERRRKEKPEAATAAKGKKK